jgi:hypothetical protein
LTIAEADIRVRATSWQLSTASGDETVHVLMSFLYFRRRGVRPLAAYACALLPPIQLERWCAEPVTRAFRGDPKRWRAYSMPVRRHTNPLLAFSRVGSTA